MNRKETTAFLSRLLVANRLSGMGKHWANEVCIDYGTKDVKRIDFMMFEPSTQTSISGIEKGIFTCFEVKSCKSDFNSGYGRNFIGEKNYFVMTMSTYKEVINEIPYGVGVLVAIPRYSNELDEFENPTKLIETDDPNDWKLHTIFPARHQERKRPMVELLFCMLRSGQTV